MSTQYTMSDGVVIESNDPRTAAWAARNHADDTGSQIESGPDTRYHAVILTTQGRAVHVRSLDTREEAKALAAHAAETLYAIETTGTVYVMSHPDSDRVADVMRRFNDEETDAEQVTM